VVLVLRDWRQGSMGLVRSAFLAAEMRLKTATATARVVGFGLVY